MNGETVYRIRALGTAWQGFTCANDFRIRADQEMTADQLRAYVSATWGDVSEVTAIAVELVRTTKWSEQIGAAFVEGQLSVTTQVVEWDDMSEAMYMECMYGEDVEV